MNSDVRITGFLCLLLYSATDSGFFDTKEPEDAMRVYAARYGSNKIIAEWPSLEEWLYSEHQKYLDKLQNGDYQLVDVVEGSLTDITFNVD